MWEAYLKIVDTGFQVINSKHKLIVIFKVIVALLIFLLLLVTIFVFSVILLLLSMTSIIVETLLVDFIVQQQLLVVSLVLVIGLDPTVAVTRLVGVHSLLSYIPSISCSTFLLLISMIARVMRRARLGLFLLDLCMLRSEILRSLCTKWPVFLPFKI